VPDPAPTRSRRSAHAQAEEADRIAGTLDRLVFFFRKWYVQEWSQDAPGSGSLIGRYMLERLGASDEPWRMTDLARVLDTSGRMVTSLVDAFEAEGVVRRVAHPSDRRAILVELAIDPAEARKPLRNYHDSSADLFDGVSDADREAFLRVAEHLIDRMGVSPRPEATPTEATPAEE